MKPLLVHATCLSLLYGGVWRGALLMGPSGIGKSDLALRAIESGCLLVSDDYSHVWTSGGQLYACAPDTISGRIEVRGLGIMRHAIKRMTRINLVAQLQAEPIERLPETETKIMLDQSLPMLRLNPLEASSVSKLLLRLRLAY
ncbi:MAG: HPr kinase/phosphatase C-terminal domain-containing protein [Asticcacaulis sp.]